MKITTFTEGKRPPANEDTYAYSETCFVVCDGSTGKKGGTYNGKTGGKVASTLMADAALKSNLNGPELVSYLTTTLQEKQVELQKLGHEMEIETTLVCARIVGSNLIVTQVADTAFRINESEEYSNPAIIDKLMSETRAHYIRLTHDVDGGRDYIMPLLLNEHAYRNNAENAAGYGVLDGTTVPTTFIKVYEFDMQEIKTLEIYTDGYFAIPDTADIDAYEALHAKIQQEDPYKYLTYTSTKSNDDRTVVIVDFTK